MWVYWERMTINRQHNPMVACQHEMVHFNELAKKIHKEAASYLAYFPILYSRWKNKSSMSRFTVAIHITAGEKFPDDRLLYYPWDHGRRFVNDSEEKQIMLAGHDNDYMTDSSTSVLHSNTLIHAIKHVIFFLQLQSKYLFKRSDCFRSDCDCFREYPLFNDLSTWSKVQGAGALRVYPNPLLLV